MVNSGGRLASDGLAHEILVLLRQLRGRLPHHAGPVLLAVWAADGARCSGERVQPRVPAALPALVHAWKQKHL